MEEEASGLQMGLRNWALAQRLLSQPGREGCPAADWVPARGGFPHGPKTLSLESPEAAPQGRGAFGTGVGDTHPAPSSLWALGSVLCTGHSWMLLEGKWCLFH